VICDLHTHTNASDGQLDVLELLDRARKYSVDMLSITDHDSIAAYQHPDIHNLYDIDLVHGIEFSTQWRKLELHIVGLNIDIKNQDLHRVIQKQTDLRMLRAERIEKKLSRLGLEDSLSGAIKYANANNIGRPHFAQYMVSCGFTSDQKQAFKRYLSVGKPAYVKPEWTSMEEIINTIKLAGGVAVIAHPAKYKLTRTRLLELLTDFKDNGGEGIEVISGRQIPSVTRELAAHCKKMELYASCGSDFHQPDRPWSELGQFNKIPDDCKPVWDLWQ
jgi:predicted metal-dependent phosphoesterase TrpH